MLVKATTGKLTTARSEAATCLHLSFWQPNGSKIFESLYTNNNKRLCILQDLPNVNLTHWGRVTHVCVSKLFIIGSDNGLLPDWRQAIILTNAGILLNGTLGTNFNEILIEIHTFSFKNIHLKMSSGKWRSFCLGLNVLKLIQVKPWKH